MQWVLYILLCGVFSSSMYGSAHAAQPALPARGPDRAPAEPLPAAAVTPVQFLPFLAGGSYCPESYAEITLYAYDWERALVPTEPGDPVFPYPRMRFEDVAGPPSPRSYKTVVLENAYTRVTLIPDLGGRIIRWEDKITDRLLTYANPVIKPTRWGYRGWWLATGGVEWAFPVDEHGLNEWRPWQAEQLCGDGWQGVRVWDKDDRTGLVVEVQLRLHDDRSDLVIAPRISNATGQPQEFQFWINAMLSLSVGNRPSPDLRFWVPTDHMIVHSTSDESLPPAGDLMDWPVFDGRDFSRYSQWQRYLGIFASEPAGAAGVYDQAADQGLVRVYPQQIARGVKLFGLGELRPDLYTDDQSAYFEFWGGLNDTFFAWDYLSIADGASIAWEEHWYPVHGIGGLTWADGRLAAAMQPGADGVAVGLYSPAPETTALVLRKNGTQVAEWNAVAGPGSPYYAFFSGAGGGWALEIWRDAALVVTLQ